MRINNKLLRSRLSGSAKHCQFLDLSGLTLDHIEGLDAFVKLEALRLSHNNIDFVYNLECCPNLWNLDLSHNQIQNLEGLERFLALGTLSLSRNSLIWSELARIQHMHILNLNLHSNPQLQRDPYYRLHVIDCLPNVWMLDGRIVTSGERIQVEQFFNDSALGEHPVRHKLPKKRFTPSVLSQREVSGVFGEKAVQLLTRFSSVSQLNRELDWKRLRYLAHNLQEDLQLEASYTRTRQGILHQHPAFLEQLLSSRDLDRPACNMMLMLLVASLEFSIPEQLLQDTLNHAKLHTLGSLQTIGLFLLPSETRCSIVSLLLSAAKVDRDSGEDGGLYDKLYMSLYFCVSELAQCNFQPQTDTQVSGSKQLLDSRSLVAAEIVQLFCIVPTFFDYITKDSGVMKVVTMATGCHDMVQVIQSTLHGLEANQMREEERYVVIADLLLSAIQKNVLDICQSRPSSRGCREHFALKTSKSIPKKPVHLSLVAADYQSQGRPSPRRPLHRTTSSRLERRDPCSKSADLGDRILLGPQVIGRIISIPEPDLVLVQLPEIPVDSGAMIVNLQNLSQHYAYQDLEELCWDVEANYWRLKGTQGDRITFHKVPEDAAQSKDSRPKTAASTIPSSSAVRRSGTVVPPGSLPLMHESGSGCLPSVAATYKAIHQLSLGATRTKSLDPRQPTPTATGRHSDEMMHNLGQRPSPENCPESARNGERPVTVQLLNMEVWPNDSGTAHDPTRPNSASSDLVQGKILTSEDEWLTDRSEENLAAEPRKDDADNQLKEAGNDEREENSRTKTDEELGSNEDIGQNNNNARWKEDVEADKDEDNNDAEELEADENAFELDYNQNNAESDQDLKEDEDRQHITEHADQQEEDEDNQNIGQYDNDHNETEDEGNQSILDHEDNEESEEIEDRNKVAEHEDNGNTVEQEDGKHLAEWKNQQNAAELKGTEIDDDEADIQLQETKGCQTESYREGEQSPLEVKDDRNVTVELDLNENTVENNETEENYETEGIAEQQEIVSPPNDTSAEVAVMSPGENEGKTVAEQVTSNEGANAVHLESVEKTMTSAGSELLETGVKEPMKHYAHTPRNAAPATRGQHDTITKNSTSDANKSVVVPSSDLPLVTEENNDSCRTEEAERVTTTRQNIVGGGGGVRFLDPPSVLRVDQDSIERRNCARSTRWLGEGRDLYRERIVRHPRHIPGWMEGLTFRPSTSLSTRRLMQFPGQSSSGQSSSEVSQRRRIGSKSAPAYGRSQKLVTTFEVIDLFSQNKMLPSPYHNKGGKFFQATPSIVRGIHQLQPRVLPASTPRPRPLPICRDCRKKHGRGEPCFRAAFSADADDADAMPYDEFFRRHLPSPS